MKKLESSLKNMVIVLTGVTVVAGALLGYRTDGDYCDCNRTFGLCQPTDCRSYC